MAAILGVSVWRAACFGPWPFVTIDFMTCSLRYRVCRVQAWAQAPTVATPAGNNSLRKPQRISHYAYYGDLYGTAELLNGSGYLFRAEGERKATLISYKDP